MSNIVDPVIECVRCTNTATLETPALRKDGDKWRPINAQRPAGWIAGTAPAHLVTIGICPRCAPEWMKLQETFITTPPVDETIEAKPGVSKAAKVGGLLVNTPIPTVYDRNIATEAGDNHSNSPIPQVGDVITAPLIAPKVVEPVTMRKTSPHTGNVVCSPIKNHIVAPPISHMTHMAPMTSPPNASAIISSGNSHVRGPVTMSPNVRHAAPVRLSGIPIAAAPPPTASPVRTMHMQEAGVPGQALVEISAPVPIEVKPKATAEVP